MCITIIIMYCLTLYKSISFCVKMDFPIPMMFEV